METERYKTVYNEKIRVKKKTSPLIFAVKIMFKVQALPCHGRHHAVNKPMYWLNKLSKVFQISNNLRWLPTSKYIGTKYCCYDIVCKYDYKFDICMQPHLKQTKQSFWK